MEDIYTWGLEKNAANYAQLTPIDFIKRTAMVYPNELAIIHGNIRRDWATTLERCKRLASALEKRGVKKGTTVSVMLPNTPAFVECHHAIPMIGAVLNSINIRLDAESISFILQHAETKVLLVDSEFSDVIQQALRRIENPPIVIDVHDELFEGEVNDIGVIEYEDLLAEGSLDYQIPPVSDEWNSIALNYTSGTTGNPKGVVYSHRGSYLAALSNILEWDMPKNPTYLWTLPMFHCNGWTFPWVIAARGGVNVCLRKVDPELIFKLIREHKVSHYCGAPIVHNLLVNSPKEWRAGIDHHVKALVAGAAPPAAMIEGMEEMGFEITHVYGLTEVYGPATVCVKKDNWQELAIGERAKLNARQGVTYHLEAETAVLNPETMEQVPWDGETIGEVMFRGNVTMKGYLKNPKTTKESFKGGWFHSGDLAVTYPDGYIKLKDRSKDIIISGGENISSIEVEDTLYQHPGVMLAAVVAKPDDKWGEVVCAFIERKEGSNVTQEELINHCKQHMAKFKVPKEIRFEELPKTATGKIQKFELRKKVSSNDAIDI
ncbi:acyl-CoA synthetase [Flavobacterium alkalisoli]|uniref:acyl-CoA synthetase n=1 Tax=Flavobacterium alkalisoli TaxID=2602769 RepID=UPI003A93F3DC